MLGLVLAVLAFGVLTSSKSSKNPIGATNSKVSGTSVGTGSGVQSHTYRGVQFQTAYFADWYNGTGYKFRFLNKDFSHFGSEWAGVQSSRADAVASAEATIDLIMGKS